MEILPQQDVLHFYLASDFGTRLHDSNRNNFELGGIKYPGVAMNSVDYYTNGDRDAETEIQKSHD